MEPPVTAMAFAVIKDSGLITSGSPADNPASINRLIPKANKTTTVSSKPVFPCEINIAMINKSNARKRFAIKIARWREMRSRIVPTKGPITEYGSRTTAKATAAPRALVCRSGEKRTKDASALWKSPSTACPVHRAANNRESLGWRKSPRKLRLCMSIRVVSLTFLFSLFFSL
jgi:hypothetical protein